MVLTDGDRIRGLLGSYCRLIDAGDFAAVGELFAHATLRDESGSVIASGAAETASLYSATTRLHADGTPRTQHVIANTVLADGSEPDRATASSTYLVFQQTPDLPLQLVITGSYLDEFVRVDGVWRFSERRFSIGLTGDLSHHLTFDLNRGTS